MRSGPVARVLTTLGPKVALVAWLVAARGMAQADFDPAPWLMRLADEERRETVLDWMGQLREENRITVWRRGLWVADQGLAAYCATQLTHDQLSRTEAERAVEVLTPHLAEHEAASEWFDQFRRMVASSEVDLLLAVLPREAPAWWSDQYLGELHRQLRGSHIPALCQLARDRGAESATAALRILGTSVVSMTDRHREMIAGAYLSHTAPGTRPVNSAGGYPAELAACLELCMVRGEVREGEWEQWLCRWTRDEVPGPSDLPLLTALAEREGLFARVAAVHGLGSLPGPASQEVLAALRDRAAADDHVRWFADATLTRRGDVRARELLEQRAGRHDLALAFLLWAAPSRGREVLLDHLRSGEADRVDLAIDALRRDDLGLYGAWLGEEQLGGLREELRRERAPRGWALARVVAGDVSCRDLDLAREAAADASIRRPVVDVTDGSLMDFLALLEVGDVATAAGLLREWASSADDYLRDHGHTMLVRLGLEEDAARLVSWIGDGHGDLADVRRLGAIRAPEVEDYLQARTASVGDDEARYVAHLAALAVYHGVPHDLAWVDEALQLPDADEVVALIRDRRPEEALGLLLDAKLADPDAVHRIDNLGLMVDDRVSAYLRALQQRRSLGVYAWATGELALMGASDAVTELRLALDEGRHGWVEDASPRIRTLNRNPGLLAHWTAELESNCCRGASADEAWEEVLGFGLGTGTEPRIARARRWWARRASDLRWSRLAGCWIPAPN